MTNILLFLGWGIAVWLVAILIVSAIEPIFKRSKKIKVKKSTIYAGTEEQVEFFEEIISAIGIEEDLSYSVTIIDGEYEIIVKG